MCHNGIKYVYQCSIPYSYRAGILHNLFGSYRAAFAPISTPFPDNMARQPVFNGLRSCLTTSRKELSPFHSLNWQFRRPYSIQSQEDAIAKLPNIDPDALSITKTTTPKELLPPEELVFGRTFTGMDSCCLIRPSARSHFSRPYALNRMDRLGRMATPTNNTLPEPQS